MKYLGGLLAPNGVTDLAGLINHTLSYLPSKKISSKAPLPVSFGSYVVLSELIILTKSKAIHYSGYAILHFSKYVNISPNV